MLIQSRKIVIVLSLLLVIVSAHAATKTFYVEETDFVRLDVEAIDPDNDWINYSYSEPLDSKGEWQTTYNDAGEYEITIIASDGDKETQETINLIVVQKNQPPHVIEKTIIIKETQTIDLKSLVEDADGDALTFNFPDNFDQNGEWTTDYEDEGRYVVDFTMSDGEHNVEARVEIIVEKTNQPPIIENVSPRGDEIFSEEGEEIEFEVEVSDPDNEKVQVEWRFDDEIISQKEKDEFLLDYETKGTHTLTLTLSDGSSTTTKTWTIIVENTNRKPSIHHPSVQVDEGEMVVLQLPNKDIDNDPLVYTFDHPLNELGEWQTGYEDAGKYSLKIIATDGEFEDSTMVEINVEDVDRVPVVQIPKEVTINEGEGLNWQFNISDPDNDNMKIEITNLPEGAFFDADAKTLSYTPSFDTIKRSGGMFSNILNSMRIERFFLNKKVIPMTFNVCGKELCEEKEMEITVYNVNREPALNYIPDVTLKENQIIKIEPSAIDPDGDIIRYYFTDPLGKKSGDWETGYEDEGDYPVWITATDGTMQQTQEMTIHVTKDNRLPTLKIHNDEVTVNEGQEFLLRVSATDLDKDDLTISIDNLPQGARFADGAFIWKPGFDIVNNKTDTLLNSFTGSEGYLNKKFSKDSEIRWLEFSVSDGEALVSQPVKVTIKNVNQAPEIIDYSPNRELVTKTGKPIIFQAISQDNDQDTLDYTWNFGFGDPKVKATNTIERIFVKPGKKNVRVTIDDGNKKVSHSWVIHVEQGEVVQKVVKPTQQQQEIGPFNVYVVTYNGDDYKTEVKPTTIPPPTPISDGYKYLEIEY